MGGLILLFCSDTIRATGLDQTQNNKHPIEGPSGPLGNGPSVNLARVRVCRAVRRLHAHYYRTQVVPSRNSPASPALFPELFEYMGLDPNAAPGQAAVSKAWTARLADLVPVGGGAAGGEGGFCDDVCKSNNVAAVKESMLKGFDGGIVEEEGLIHAVASVLWENDSRAEYVDHFLPVLRPPASRIPIFKRADAGGVEAICPRNWPR
ncbi:hypothetical protein ColTof4_01388 [Colletotrichum tofieldiae]|nr:hypothetical protein ColTof3_08642 [Colletotrichum tofieldiae]GKT68965.1 hypothetical protein ColTof4_01388 [Colletotrichum tofieldiae]GKT96826.1 hypothetical protein Ct61P_14676 [Colletotrichum tofieldiae]